MNDPSAIHSTFVIERIYPAPVERVFAAFADATKKRSWFAEGEKHDIEEFGMEFRVGGGERLRYRFGEGTPFPGLVITNDGIYQDIVPDRRIVTASTVTFGDKRISVSLMTFEFLAGENGADLICTHLICTHQGVFFEDSDGPQIREAGWRGLLEKLTSQV